MIKKLSAIFIALFATSCSCYSDLFKDSSQCRTLQCRAEEPAPAKTVKELNQSVFFASDSFALNSKTREVLDEEILPSIKGRKITIEGHCDERGSVAYNQILGRKRAEAVKDYLVQNGADASQIKTVSYGKSEPLDLDHDADAWAKNRRAVTISTKK